MRRAYPVTMSAARDPVSLANSQVRISFDAGSGRLVSLFARPHEREYLARATAGGPFALWHGFRQPYVFTASHPQGACDRAPDPADLAAGCFTPGDAPLEPGTLAEARLDGESLRLVYRDAATGLVVAVTVALEGRASRWTLTVTNGGLHPREVMASFPWWRGLNLSREAGGRMLAMNQAGYVGSLWHHRGGVYGASSRQSAQFGCLFENATSDCFGFRVDDPDCGAKEILFVEPDVQVRWFPPRALGPGDSITYPATVLLLYSGSWKETAREYGDWFRSTFKPDRVPEWVRHNESYAGAWTEKHGKEYVALTGPQPDDLPSGSMDSFDELATHYLRIPTQTIEFAFFCRQSELIDDHENGGLIPPEKRRHTDGWNEMRQDLGGMPAFRRGVEAVHRMGRRITLYVEGLIVPEESELFDHLPSARDWVVVNADGTTNGNYTKHGFVHMCPGSVEWQDHLAAMCSRLMREGGIDGIRIDSLNYYFWPCHNPTHRHASPFDYNRWVQELYAKVSRAVRDVKPDALLSTEAPADFAFRHFNHSLHSMNDLEIPYSVTEGASPLRVALPEYRLHSTATVAAPVLQLQPIWQYVGAEDAPWVAAYPALAAVFCDGDATNPDPVTDRPDMTTRWVQGSSEDLVTGVRWLPPEEPKHIVKLLPRENRQRTQVTVPLGYEPAAAWIFDLQGRRLAQLAWQAADGGVSFTVETNWFAVLFRRTTGPVPCWIELPEKVAAGDSAVGHIHAPGLTTPVDATLRVPALNGLERMRTRVPGEVVLHIPAGTPPAWYRAELGGRGLCSTVALFRVSPPAKPRSPPRAGTGGSRQGPAADP